MRMSEIGGTIWDRYKAREEEIGESEFDTKMEVEVDWRTLWGSKVEEEEIGEREFEAEIEVEFDWRTWWGGEAKALGEEKDWDGETNGKKFL